MRLLDVSNETPDSDVSESMTMGFSDPLGWDGATLAACTAAYVAPPPVGSGYLQLSTSRSPVSDELAGSGAGPALVAGRLWAGSIESPELASPLALRLPTSCWESAAPLPDVVLRLPEVKAGFSFLRAMASLNSSSCLSMTLR